MLYSVETPMLVKVTSYPNIITSWFTLLPKGRHHHMRTCSSRLRVTQPIDPFNKKYFFPTNVLNFFTHMFFYFSLNNSWVYFLLTDSLESRSVRGASVIGLQLDCHKALSHLSHQVCRWCILSTRPDLILPRHTLLDVATISCLG